MSSTFLTIFLHRRAWRLTAVAVLVLLAAAIAGMRFQGGGGDSGEPSSDSGIRDAAGGTVTLPAEVERVLCSGSGCLRLLTYLQAHDRIVAVDSIETRGSPIDARPYAIANPQFESYPVFGEFRGWDNPELIAGLSPSPQLIFKIAAGRGQDPAGLQAKTGIPVIPLDYGNLTNHRERLNGSLRRMAKVMGSSRRAEEVIEYFDALENDLRERTRDVPAGKRPSCYVAGLGHRGPHGVQSTDPSFPPFMFTHARNVSAASFSDDLTHAMISKEQLVAWDPEVIFLDVSTLRLPNDANALEQLRQDPVYKSLSAVRNDKVYGLFPSNSYNRNFGTIFANAYFVGKTLYPERFADIDPMAKAEEISTFLNGGAAFYVLNEQFDGLPFNSIEITQ